MATSPTKKTLRLPDNFKFDRAKAGTVFDIAVSIADRLIDGTGLDDAIQQEISERAVQRYQPHLKAAFARYGIPLEGDGSITVDVLLRAIQYKTGLEVLTLTKEGLEQAIDSYAAKELSRYLGVTIDTVLNFEAIKTALVQSAVNAVQSGRATKLISRAIVRRIQTRSTWTKAGIGLVDQKKLQNREYQRQWRKGHVQKWES